MGWKLAMATGALVLGLGGTAQAETLCVAVEREDCGASFSELPPALAAAADGDTVLVGPGVYAGAFSAGAGVTVQGTSREGTVIRATTDGVAALSLGPGGWARDLTVELEDGNNMTGIAGPDAAGVTIAGAAPNATGFAGARFQSGAVALTGPGTTGVRHGLLDQDTFVQAATIRAGMGISTGEASPAFVTTTRIRAFTGINVVGRLNAQQVVIELEGEPNNLGGPWGVFRLPHDDSPTTTLSQVTIAGDGAGTGLELRAEPDHPLVAAVNDSVITGVTTPIRTCATPQPACPDTASHVTTANSAYDPTNVPPGDTVPSTDPIAADPRLDADLRPRFGSPLLDRFTPTMFDDLDASLLPRAVDADGDGTAQRDIGALEYQRRAPQVDLVTAIPDAVKVGEPIAFSADATDPEGEALSAAWKFSDGTTAAGFDVARAFTTPGTVTATVTVSDEAGAAAAASVKVKVEAPAQQPPPPAGDPGPAAKRPPVIARVLPQTVELRAVKRRDRHAPYRFKLRGKVVLPAGVSAAGCKDGKVALAIRAGKRKLSRSATLRPDCTFRLTLALGRKKARRVTVTPRFAGTAALAPLDGRALKLRAG